MLMLFTGCIPVPQRTNPLSGRFATALLLSLSVTQNTGVLIKREKEQKWRGKETFSGDQGRLRMESVVEQQRGCRVADALQRERLFMDAF